MLAGLLNQYFTDWLRIINIIDILFPWTLLSGFGDHIRCNYSHLVLNRVQVVDQLRALEVIIDPLRCQVIVLDFSSIEWLGFVHFDLDGQFVWLCFVQFVIFEFNLLLVCLFSTF